MGWQFINGRPVITARSGSWTPQNLVVENVQPTKVVMTGSVSNTTALADDFTISGFTIDSLAKDATNKILTLTLSVAVISSDVLIVVFKGNSYNVTNNVNP